MTTIVLERPAEVRRAWSFWPKRGPAIMDRYLLRQFLQSFVICFISQTRL